MKVFVFQPKPRDIMKKLVSSLSHVALVENFNRSHVDPRQRPSLPEIQVTSVEKISLPAPANTKWLNLSILPEGP
jgi:hypothetical protein